MGGCAGVSFFDMDRSELTQRYAKAPTEDARRLWDGLYESCLDGCVHGPTCPSAGVCTQGRRLTKARRPRLPAVFVRPRPPRPRTRRSEHCSRQHGAEALMHRRAVAGPRAAR